VRLAAVDLDRMIGTRGLSVGLMAGIPGTRSDFKLATGGVTVVKSEEDDELDLTGGVHWRSGARDWFMAGAFVNLIRDPVTTDGVDVATLTSYQRNGTTNAWFARAGVSILPFVPSGLTDGSTSRAEWLGEIRVAADVEYRNILVPGESVRATRSATSASMRGCCPTPGIRSRTTCACT